MNDRQMLEKAIMIASVAHMGKVDKGGSPYILHPLWVMMGFSDVIHQTCAVLHDAPEDSNYSIGSLADMGFPVEVILAIDCLTRRERETYDKYINRVVSNKISARVKLRDLEHNMQLSRIPNPTETDMRRVEKYRNYYDIIKGVLDAEEHS